MKLPVPLIAGSKVEYLDPVSFRSAGPTDTRLKATTVRCEDANASATSTRAALEKEHAAQTRSHLGSEMLVSITVREDPAMADAEAPTGKLVARNGKLEVVPDGPRAALMPLPPSGTAFAITTTSPDAPAESQEDQQKLRDLDRTNLIVGKIIQGEDVIRRIKGLPFNPPNADSLFFKAGKAGGDKRALVAERGFYRPFSKIVVTNAGFT